MRMRDSLAAARPLSTRRAPSLTYALEHDPEKWIPVFRKDHAQIKEVERDDVL
jgi:hypothetical protein